MRTGGYTAVILTGLALAACGDGGPAKPPPPADPPQGATGHRTAMLLAEHGGPMGQVFLEGRDKPLWFLTARDAIAYLAGPARPAPVLGGYVSDMGGAGGWDAPRAWVRAKKAHYVVRTGRKGGTRQPAFIPFRDREKARDYAQEHGGRVVPYKMVAKMATGGM